MMSDTWTYERKPSSAGWYAILYCWEPEEGVFHGASCWDGKTWDQDLPISGFHGPHESEAAAAAWADAHDPGL